MAALLPGPKELQDVPDRDLLDHLDAVSDEIKRRNGLLPRTAGQAAVDVMKAIKDLSSAGRGG